MNDVAQIQTLFLDDKSQIRGALRILAPLGFGTKYIAPIMSDFLKMYPNINLELELSDKPNWSDSHRWDMIIYIGELRDSSLKLMKLAANQRFLCASPEYLKDHGAPKSPHQLVDHHCIALRENFEDVTLWRFTDKKSETEESVRIVPKLASNDGSVTKAWALKGQGIMLRSEWDVQAELNNGALKRVLSNYSLPSADIVALLGTDNRSRTAKTKKFLAYLKQRIAQKPWLNNE